MRFSKKMDVRSLPSVSLLDRRSLPIFGGVYFVYDDSEILYIGMTGGIKIRLASHRIVHQVAHMRGVRVAWIEVGEYYGRIFESKAIAHFDPILNGNVSVLSVPELKVMRLGESDLRERFIRHFENIPTNERSEKAIAPKIPCGVKTVKEILQRRKPCRGMAGIGIKNWCEKQEEK